MGRYSRLNELGYRAYSSFSSKKEKKNKGVTVRDAHLFVCPVALTYVLGIDSQSLQHLFNCNLVGLVRMG